MSLAENPEGSYAEEALQKYGYQQEFRRELKRFASFAIGFSFISITTGIFTTYGFVLINSGPLGIWTWPLVIIGQLFVSLVFATLASRMPLAGYSYQWVSRLANPKVGWLIGWISFIFLIVDVVAVDYAVSATVLPSLFKYTETPQNAWLATTIVILLQMLLIMFSTLWSTRINNAAVGTEIVGIVGLTLLLVIVGAVRGMLQPGHLFSTGSAPSPWFGFGTLTTDSPFMLSFLLGAFTIVGFEAAANLAEETQDAHRTVPTAMWFAVLLSGVVGFAFLIALNLASQDIAALTASATPVADIVTQMLGTLVGDIFLVFVTFSIFACGLVIFITVTRLTWAMSRDERFPGYSVFRKVGRQTSYSYCRHITLRHSYCGSVGILCLVRDCGSKPEQYIKLICLVRLLCCQRLFILLLLCFTFMLGANCQRLMDSAWVPGSGRSSFYRSSGCFLNSQSSATNSLLLHGFILLSCSVLDLFTSSGCL